MRRQLRNGANWYDDFGESTEPFVRIQVVNAFLNRGVALVNLGRPEEAIAEWDELVRRFGKDTEQVIMELVAKALSRRVVTLGSLGHK